MTQGNLQPNSKMCFICGLENPVGLKLRIYEVEPGRVESTFTAPEHFQGYPGVLHGGIIATIIDEISGRALLGSVDHPRFMFTAKLEVKYRKNVPIGPRHLEVPRLARPHPRRRPGRHRELARGPCRRRLAPDRLVRLLPRRQALVQARDPHREHRGAAGPLRLRVRRRAVGRPLRLRARERRLAPRRDCPRRRGRSPSRRTAGRASSTRRAGSPTSSPGWATSCRTASTSRTSPGSKFERLGQPLDSNEVFIGLEWLAQVLQPGEQRSYLLAIGITRLDEALGVPVLPEGAGPP